MTQDIRRFLEQSDRAASFRRLFGRDEALGAVLDLYAFPAILIGLFFQALVFGHGGLTTLGVNAVMIGLPALLAAQIFKMRHPCERWFGPKLSAGIFSFLAGTKLPEYSQLARAPVTMDESKSETLCKYFYYHITSLINYYT